VNVIEFGVVLRCGIPRSFKCGGCLYSIGILRTVPYPGPFKNLLWVAMLDAALPTVGRSEKHKHSYCAYTLTLKYWNNLIRITPMCIHKRWKCSRIIHVRSWFCARTSARVYRPPTPSHQAKLLVLLFLASLTKPSLSYSHFYT